MHVQHNTASTDRGAEGYFTVQRTINSKITQLEIKGVQSEDDKKEVWLGFLTHALFSSTILNFTNSLFLYPK